MVSLRSWSVLAMLASSCAWDFTPKEYNAVNEFGTTKLYQKLVNEAVMTRSSVARPLIQARAVEIMQRCRGS